MGHKVILTPQAQDDLREIVSFIAQQNSDRARSFCHELIDHALSLTELPERGRTVPEISDPNVREIVHRPLRPARRPSRRLMEQHRPRDGVRLAWEQATPTSTASAFIARAHVWRRLLVVVMVD